MARVFLFFALVIPLVSLLLLKFQDADISLLIYEKVGANPAISLRGKVVWITGASSGIGEHLAYELVKCGCKLVLSARRKEELERVKDKCSAIASGVNPSFQKDQDILVLPLDLRKFQSHHELAKGVLKHFGKVDILVNNAARSQRSLVEKTPLNVDRVLLDINTIGTISMTKAVLPHMIEHRQGQIVVVSSFLGKFGFPYEATYCASKYALQGYFDSLRLEAAEHNIHVQIICPGPVKSNIAREAFTEKINVAFKDTPSYSDKMIRMPTERFAQLMAVSIANHNLDEVWIADQPYLLIPYINQYLPSIFRWLSKTFLMKKATEAYVKQPPKINE